MLPSSELLKSLAEEPFSQSDRWTWVRAFPVRVISVYLLLYTFPGPLRRVPGMTWLDTVRWALELPVVSWTAKYVFHLQNPGSPNGSDTVFRYIEVFCFFVLAVVIASVWSALDRTQKHDKQVQQAFRLYLRYTLAFTMFSYGTSKILKSQFPSLGPSVLQQTYGDSTPMELLWIFMGYSTIYTIFTGLVETVGGLLLLFRRTVTLGALVSTIALTQVVLLNISYDVNVKLLSLHLLLMSLFLLAADASRLANVLIWNRTAAPGSLEPLFGKNGKMRIARITMKTALLTTVLFLLSQRAYHAWTSWGDAAPQPGAYGAYAVETFARTSANSSEAVKATDNWQKVFVDMGKLTVVTANGARQVFLMDDDAAHQRMTMFSRVGGKTSQLAYSRSADGHLTLQGSLENGHMDVRLRSLSSAESSLIKHKIHWIDDYSGN